MVSHNRRTSFIEKTLLCAVVYLLVFPDGFYTSVTLLVSKQPLINVSVLFYIYFSINASILNAILAFRVP